MFAVIKTGGKQYKVAQGDVITVEKLDAAEGEGVDFGEVLMIGGDAPSVGAPTIAGASVKGEVVEQGRAPKVYTFHKRRRKSSSKRLRGHRQYQTKVRVTEIVTG
jgi:large subunit ribosomal protein L21